MIEISLFGKLEVTRDGVPVEIPSQPAQLLLAYLVLNAGTLHRRDRLAGLLWPNSDEINARNNLRQALWRLRQAIGEEYVLADRTSVGWNPDAEYRSDIAILAEGDTEDPSADALIRSVSVYDDLLLPGFYEDWVVLEQERWQALFEDRMQALLDRLCDEARWREVLQWAERWIAYGHVPEPAYRALMLAHAALGDQSGAAAIFQRCTEALDRDLGVRPSAETQALFQRLTSGDRVLGTQVQEVESAPVVNLPYWPTPLLGREEELSQLDSVLANPATRLVTILGPGGIGKTRLAIEVGRARSVAYADGAFFVPLESLDDPDLVVSSIAAILAFSFYTRHQREHWEFDSQREQLLAYLQNKRLLLILDNLEHILDRPVSGDTEGVEGVAGLVSDILRIAPGVQLLATSRERLDLYGETVFSLEGLSYPERKAARLGGTATAQELEGLAACPAVRLFVQTARRGQPDFELAADNVGGVIDICHLTDGMPLALELAASWVEVLSPAEIAAEIRTSYEFLQTKVRDVPERQHSIRSVVEASWQRLGRSEQELFPKLSVFRGGFTRDAAQKVADASLPGLMALVHKSLLRSDTTGRYQMHELLRRFGQERMADLPSEEIAARDRHCAYYSAFLKTKESGLIGQSQGEALAAIETELANVRAAWDWAVAHDRLNEIELAMESLAEFYRIRGGVDEGYETFYPAAMALGWEGFRADPQLSNGHSLYMETLHLVDEGALPDHRLSRKQEILGRVLARYGRFYCESPGRAQKACQVRQDSLRILGDLGARQEMAYLLRYGAHIGHTPLESRELYRRALAVFEESDDERGASETLFCLGWVEAQLGEYNEAMRLYHDSLALSERLDRQEIVANCNLELGYVHWALGNYRMAEQRCRKGHSSFAGIGYPSRKALALRYLARISMVQGDYPTARNHLRESLAIYRQIGLRGMRALALGELGHVALLENDLAQAESMALESLAICKATENRQGMAEPETVLGSIALRLGDLERAQEHFQNALSMAVESWTWTQALHTLLALSHLLVVTGKDERALEVITLVQHHRASWQWSRDQAAALGGELQGRLPSGVAKRASARGTETTLQDLARELLGEAV